MPVFMRVVVYLEEGTKLQAWRRDTVFSKAEARCASSKLNCEARGLSGVLARGLTDLIFMELCPTPPRNEAPQVNRISFAASLKVT